MSKTDSNVVITQYPAKFGYPAARATIDFSAKRWNIGGWEFKETLTRRRRHTVVKDFAAEYGDDFTNATEEIKRNYPGLWRNSSDQEAAAVLVKSTNPHTGEAFTTLAFIEQISR